MKSLLLVGGLLGLGVGMGASYLQDNSWPTCIWHGCLAAYVVALLMRWWGRLWRTSLEQSIQDRERAAEKAEKVEKPVVPPSIIPKATRT